MDNKEIIRRLFDEALNKGDVEALNELIAEDYTDHNPVPGQLPGAEGIRIKLDALRRAFPDILFFLEDLICEGDMAAARYHWRGTNQGSFMEIPPTGKKVEIRGMDFYRIKEGRIAEHWHNVDELGLLRQLGVMGQEEG